MVANNSLNLSVNICVYNKDDPLLFGKALASIAMQSLLPEEVVLAVDGPISAELESVIELFNKRFHELDVDFKVRRLKTNCGHGVARQLALDNSKSIFVAICDADDISHPERFEKIIESLEKSNADVCGSDIREINTSNTQLISYRTVESSHDLIIKDFKFRCPMNQMSVIFRREAVLQVGGYLDFHNNEDYFLWMRMLLAGYRFHNVKEVLVDATVNEDYYGRRGGIKYFRSELKLQIMFFKFKIISFPLFVLNVFKRFLVQVVIPSYLRSYIFRKFARKNALKRHKE